MHSRRSPPITSTLSSRAAAKRTVLSRSRAAQQLIESGWWRGATGGRDYHGKHEHSGGPRSSSAASGRKTQSECSNAPILS
mmetsp:Transcript_54471/g.161866  ORF Transcript_54471/g.161866 Transcript_54471/m.161866 type:complete len:81 (-) Transcript_54471:3-245(-)